MADGFDIHHMDGVHENNDPLNLVLIECGDHLMLHNGKMRFSRVVGRKGARGPQRKTQARMQAAKNEDELILPAGQLPNPWPPNLKWRNG